MFIRVPRFEIHAYSSGAESESCEDVTTDLFGKSRLFHEPANFQSVPTGTCPQHLPVVPHKVVAEVSRRWKL